MIIIILIVLTIISILLAIGSEEEANLKHMIITVLTIFQFLIVYSTYKNGGITDFFEYPISYWIGFFWASIISIIISLCMFIGKIRNDRQNKNKK